jgi:hypothetical protein
MPTFARQPEPLPLADRIRDDAFARQALETLVSRGAERDALWGFLCALETSQLLGFSNWNQRSRLTKKQAKALAKKLSKNANEIRVFFAPDLYWFLTIERQFGWIDDLQENLRRMVRLIEELARTNDDRGADDARTAKMRLTKYVQTATGKPHDREVAELTRVTLNLDVYTADEQRKFRTRPPKTGQI